jgi:hypothetical protein
MQPFSPVQSTSQFLNVGSEALPPKKDDDSKKSGQIFKNAFEDLSTGKNPSIAEYNVTLHTAPKTGSKALEGVQVEGPSTEIKTPKIEKKKKKKKNKTTEQQVVALIGRSAFGLAPMPPPPSTKATSLYCQIGCPSFRESEKKLLNEILEENIFFESSNLLEVFMSDFYKHGKKIIEISKKLSNQFNLGVIETLEKNNVVQAIFTFEKNLLKVDIDDNVYIFQDSDKIFNSPISCMQLFITNFIKIGICDIKNVILKDIENFKNSRKRAPLALIEFNECIQLYEAKLKLFLRCVLDKNVKMFCLDTKTNLWIESAQANIQNEQYLLKKIQQLSSFIKFIIESSDELKNELEIKDLVNSYIDSITSIIAGKISKKSLTSFMQAYKQYALSNSQKIAYIKSIEHDPELLAEHASNVFMPRRYSLELLDKWMSDLHEAICFHFYEEFNAMGVSSPQIHLERLLTMIHIARTGVDEIARSKEDNTSSDPFVASIRESIQKLTSEIEHEFHESNILRGFLQSGHGELIENMLMEELQSKPFQLTHLFSEIPTSMRAHISGGKINILIKQMNHALFEMVKDAKKNNKLEHWNSKDLKEKIQEILLDETLDLCVYLMIMAETNNLCSEHQTNGFTSFLPSEIVSLLDLTGFEKLFAESPLLQSPSESPVTSEDESNLPTQQEEKPSREPSPHAASETAKKTDQKNAVTATTSSQAKPPQASKKTELPTKQDFKDAVNERIFHRLMIRLGFTRSTYGKHPGYEKNGYRIPVPHNLQAVGTRVSVYELATAPSRNSEGKDFGN